MQFFKVATGYLRNQAKRAKRKEKRKSRDVPPPSITTAAAVATAADPFKAAAASLAAASKKRVSIVASNGTPGKTRFRVGYLNKIVDRSNLVT